jgi:hypothetical protein
MRVGWSEGTTPQQAPNAPAQEISVGADDLPVEDAVLVVVQAEPVTQTGLRFDSDREKAASLRLFAAQVFDAGAHNVLVVPPLSEDVAAEGLRRVASTLRGPSAPHRSQLLDATEALRQQILTSPLPPDDGEEVALDLCLFARSAPV